MLTQFLREEEGQTTVEYLLIIAVIVVVIATLGKGLRDKVPQVVDKVFGGVTAQIDKLMGAAK